MNYEHVHRDFILKNEKKIPLSLLFFSLNLNLLSWVFSTIKVVEFWLCLFFWVYTAFLAMFCFCKF